jgi:adenosylcobinamide kinase/adenosylcobinamide-phosphate guanylyltransferase
MSLKKIILITGGVRGGKSRYALTLARRINGPRIFLATAQPFDDGLRQRVQKHKEQRGAEFRTVEEPVYLGKALATVGKAPAVVVIDCLTVWVNNLFHEMKDNVKAIQEQKDSFVRALTDCPSTVIIVTNEVGMGIMPDNPLARDFADALGKLNQQIAQLSDEVILMVSGIPSWVKGKEIPEGGVPLCQDVSINRRGNLKASRNSLKRD